MAYYTAEGSKFYFSSSAGFAAAKTITALSNASPAVATSTSHGYVDGDIVYLNSGWGEATDTLWKVDQQDANNFQLTGLDATDTDVYPSGSGTGTAKLVSSWTEIPQIIGISTQGGDVRMTNVELLARRSAIQIPTGFNPQSVTLTLAHDPADVNYQTMVALSRVNTPCGFKMVLSGGAVAYGYGHLNVSEMPQLNRNQVNQVQCTFALLGKLITY